MIPCPVRQRVVLVDDHPLVRDGIRLRLEASAEVDIVGEAGSLAEAARLVDEMLPDLVITDIRMPSASGVHLVALLAERHPAVKVLVLSMLKDPAFVQRAMALGACGYVLKDDPGEHLIDAVHAVSAGQTYLSPGVASLVASCASLPRARRRLTPKEAEVLNLLAQGRSNKEIATLLGASVRTIESHRLHLKRKLQVEGRAALVKYAVDYSDLELPSPGEPSQPMPLDGISP